MNPLISYNFISKNGSEFLVRYPKKSDLIRMHKFINNLSNELTYVNFQNEKISLEEEGAYLAEQLKRIKKLHSVQLLAFKGTNLAGICSIDLEHGASSHIGNLELSLDRNYRDQGLGSELLRLILKEAAKNIQDLRLITLSLFDINSKALNLYIKNGFKVFGRLPNGIYFKNNYYDKIYMYKKINT